MSDRCLRLTSSKDRVSKANGSAVPTTHGSAVPTMHGSRLDGRMLMTLSLHRVTGDGDVRPGYGYGSSMQATVKIGAAALGGYVLGRTKKAKTAVGLALFLTGRGRARDIARDQVIKALKSDKGQELISQLRGPVVSAGRQAAIGLFEAQVGRVSDDLQRRTEKIGGAAQKSVGRAGSSGKQLTGRATRATRKSDDEDGKPASTRKSSASTRKSDDENAKPASTRRTSRNRRPKSKDDEVPDTRDEALDEEEAYDDEDLGEEYDEQQDLGDDEDEFDDEDELIEEGARR